MKLSFRHLKSQLPYLPWHAILFIIYMYLYGFQRLGGNIILGEFMGLMALAIGASIVIFLITQSVFGIYKASLIAFILSVAFFVFGHIYHIFSFAYSAYVNYLPAVFTLLIVLMVSLVALSKLAFIEFNKSLNILASILGVLAAIQFGQYLLGLQALMREEATYDPLLLDIDTLDSTQLDPVPDVYFLLFDAYPSNSYLLDHFGIDNSAFTDELEERGFYVAYDATSNYTGTKASVSSTLNMDFVQNFAPENFGVSYDVLDSFMPNNRVARMFQDIGYHYIHFGNGLTKTTPSIGDTIIDVRVDGTLVEDFDNPAFGKRSFMSYLLVTTWLRALNPRLSANPDAVGTASLHSNLRFHTSIDVLHTIPAMPEPTFTYFHSIKPHLPATLDADGNDFDSIDLYSNLQDYLNNEELHVEDQIIYVNKVIIETIDLILEQSDIPPIIILQADHGMTLSREIPADEHVIQQRPIAIMSAFYFPDGDYSNLYQEISSVNTFPVVLNQYFGMDYPLLDDTRRYYLPARSGEGVVQAPLVFEPIPEGRIEPPYDIDN